MAEDILTLTLEDKLYRTKYEHVPDHPHIRINDKVCCACEAKYCVRACPAGVYKLDTNEKTRIVVQHDNCLECGTCIQICVEGSIDWNYPDGGMGVKYRFG